MLFIQAAERQETERQMRCKKLLKELGLKSYLVREGQLIPINHKETMKMSDKDNSVAVVRLKDLVDWFEMNY